jgi:AcrR family transcriptional regulator
VDSTETDAARRGRPRDPDVEERVFDAAMRLYAEHGWVGFTFEAVARETGIGKPALYRRWSSRGELLDQTFRARWFVVDRIDTGNLHDDLLALARMTLDHMLGSHGQAVVHMLIDARRYREVSTSTASYREAMVASAREMVRRGIRRGELPAGTSPALVLDMVFGASMNHATSTPTDLLPQVVANSDDFARTLVNAVLRGLAR